MCSPILPRGRCWLIAGLLLAGVPAAWAQVKAGEVFDLSALEVMPQNIKQRPPVYPDSLGGAGLVGKVMEATTPEMGQAVRAMIDAWRFELPRKAGKPVVTRVRIPVSFKPAKIDPTEDKAP